MGNAQERAVIALVDDRKKSFIDEDRQLSNIQTNPSVWRPLKVKYHGRRGFGKCSLLDGEDDGFLDGDPRRLLEKSPMRGELILRHTKEPKQQTRKKKSGIHEVGSSAG